MIPRRLCIVAPMYATAHTELTILCRLGAFRSPHGASIMSAAALPSLKFVEMTIVGKVFFLVKLCLFIASFGFAFPTLLTD